MTLFPRKESVNPRLIDARPDEQGEVNPGAINKSIISAYTENPGNTSRKGGYKNINKRTTEILGKDWEIDISRHNS
jgi:hypothetical protein